MTTIYRHLAADEQRARQVIADVLAALSKDRNCLVLTNRTTHLEKFAACCSKPGRSWADRVHHSRLTNLKELRPGSAGRSEIRILYIFDPKRNAVLLVAGDKAGKWAA